MSVHVKVWFKVVSVHVKVCACLKVHLTPKFFFRRDEIVQRSHKEFDNFISIWYF